MSQTDDLPVALDPQVYESYVADAADWLDDGLYTIDDREVPDELAEYDIGRARFVADVRERAAEEYSDAPDTDDDAIRQTGRIDWGALFKEYNWHTVDADGRHAVPETAVLEGIRVSDQGIAGDASSHLSRAVEAGALEREATVAKNGEPTLRGYRCPEVHPDGT